MRPARHLPTLAALAFLLAPAAQAQTGMAATPAAHITFTLTDPASSGEGLLGHGTLAYQGHNYTFEATGLHMIRTSANAPASLAGDVFNLAAPTDLNGDYTSVAGHKTRAYVLQNAHGVRLALQPLTGGARIPPHDAASPITIKLNP